MILARPVCASPSAELELAFFRLGLPRPAREYLGEKVVPVQLLLTGLSRAEGAFLRARFEGCTSPGHEDFPFYVAGDQQKRPGTGLLVGRKEQLERLIAAAREEALEALAAALERALWASQPPAPLVLRGRTFAFGGRPYLMGVVNVTPDSFSDGGRFLAADAAVRHGLSLVEAGADLLDVGGESTRPGAQSVDAQEELARILPVLRGLRERTDVPISVDTTKADVAQRALEAGADLVNDVSGFHFDERLPGVVAAHGAACCLMHLQGTPRTMQQTPRYEDLTAEVLEYLARGVERAVSAGVARARILVDPGIGFGKTVGHNLSLLRRLHELRTLGLPVLVGTSRKSFLGRLLEDRPVDQRMVATMATVAAMAVTAGADVVRVHDVQEAKDAVVVATAIRLAAEAGELFDPATPTGGA